MFKKIFEEALFLAISSLSFSGGDEINPWELTGTGVGIPFNLRKLNIIGCGSDDFSMVTAVAAEVWGDITFLV